MAPPKVWRRKRIPMFSKKSSYPKRRGDGLLDLGELHKVKEGYILVTSHLAWYGILSNND